MFTPNKDQKRELAVLRRGPATISNDADEAAVYETLVAEGAAIITDSDEDSTTYSLPTRPFEDVSGCKPVQGKALKTLEFWGYTDTGFRTLERNEALVEAKRLRSEGRAASVHPCVLRRGTNVYGVWAGEKDTATRGNSCTPAALAKRAKAILDLGPNADISEALEVLKTAIEAAEQS